MKTFQSLAAIAVCTLGLAGCSEQTKQESREALDATKEAAESAGEDIKVNAKKAVEVGKTAVDKAKDEFSDPPPSTPPTTTDADADGVPDSKDPAP